MDPEKKETPAGDKPPAAALVVKSDATEKDAAEIIALKRAKEDAENKLKEREIRLSELEDENRRLKTPPAPPSKTPHAEKLKRAWLNGVFE